jgi:endonuclease-8
VAEGDSIRRLAARLARVAGGRVVTASSFRTPRLALADVSGRRVDAVTPYGKHLLMALSAGPDAEGARSRPLTLHSHLRMQGRWSVEPGVAAVGRSDPRDGVRVVLALDDHCCLVGRRLPVLDLVPTVDAHRLLDHLGPDILDDAWDGHAAARRLSVAPDRPVVAGLLDQRTVAGIGNLYAVEGLFLAGMWPWTPVGAIAAPGALLDGVRALMRRQLALGHQATTGDPRRHRRHWVYGRAGRPCRRCGAAIRRHDGGADPYDRDTWWCPTCQPPP